MSHVIFKSWYYFLMPRAAPETGQTLTLTLFDANYMDCSCCSWFGVGTYLSAIIIEQFLARFLECMYDAHWHFFSLCTVDSCMITGRPVTQYSPLATAYLTAFLGSLGSSAPSPSLSLAWCSRPSFRERSEQVLWAIKRATTVGALTHTLQQSSNPIIIL